MEFAPHVMQLAAAGPLTWLFPQGAHPLEPPGLEVPAAQAGQVRFVVALPPVAPWPGSQLMNAVHIMLPVPVAKVSAAQAGQLFAVPGVADAVPSAHGVHEEVLLLGPLYWPAGQAPHARSWMSEGASVCR